MSPRCPMRHFLPVALCLVTFGITLSAQSASTPDSNSGADLQMVVILSRHGVRSPLPMQPDAAKYSAAPWPVWSVAPGIQTARGNELIRLFGEWDRGKLSGEGLLAPTGCADAAHVTILADTDQRTRETGKSLAEGIFPGCPLTVHALPGATIDPLFRPIEAGAVHPDRALAFAAVSGRIGGNPNNLTEAYRPQLAALDRVLAGCGHLPVNSKRTSIFDIPARLSPSVTSSLISVSGPLVTASAMVENFLLEYTQGMSDADTGWGCIDGANLRYFMQLDTARWDYADRTPAIARLNASNLIDHIRSTMQQGVTGKPVPGAIGNPGDRLVIIVGHDSNIVTVAGALGINWVLDGRVDDTPPGGALWFELWRSRADGEHFVRVEYRAQTLEQMRKAEPLTSANPPAEAPIFVPGCSRQDLSCSWEDFSAALRRAIDPADIVAQP